MYVYVYEVPPFAIRHFYRFIGSSVAQQLLLLFIRVLHGRHTYACPSVHPSVRPCQPTTIEQRHSAGAAGAAGAAVFTPGRGNIWLSFEARLTTIQNLEIYPQNEEDESGWLLVGWPIK